MGEIKINENEKSVVRLVKTTVVLGIRYKDTANKQFISKDLGTYSIITDKSVRSVQLIARLKEVYPDLQQYINITILDRVQEIIKHEVSTVDLINHFNIKI